MLVTARSQKAACTPSFEGVSSVSLVRGDLLHVAPGVPAFATKL